MAAYENEFAVMTRAKISDPLTIHTSVFISIERGCQIKRKKGLRVPATNLRTPLTGETDTVETGRQTGGTNWKRNGLLARRERIRRHGMAGRAG